MTTTGAMAATVRGRIPQRARLVHAWSLSGLSAPRKARRLAFFGLLLAPLVVSTACAVIALTWVGKPFAGFLLNERMVVGNVGQYHWTGVQAGLKWPDKILGANGRPVPSMRDLHEVVREAEIGAPVTYSVDRDGSVVQLSVATMRFTWTDLATTFGIPFLSGLLYLGIGVVVFLLKPDVLVSWAFLLACFFLSLFAITSFDVQSTHRFVRVYILVNTFFPAAFLHLSLVFPERRALIERHPRLQLAPYLASTALAILLQLLYPRPTMLPFQQLIRLYAILSAAAMLGSAMHALVASPSVLARQRGKVVLFGVALAFPIPAVAYYLSLFGGESFRAAIQNNFLAIPILIFPASVAYAIARHNLFDVDVYIKRAVGYGVMTVMVGFAYLSLQLLARPVLLDPLLAEYAEEVYPFLFGLLVVCLFNPINRKIQEIVDKVFYRKEFDYKQAVGAVSDALTLLLNLDEIVKQVLRAVRKEMFVDAAGVIVFEREAQGCRTFFAADEPRGGRKREAADEPQAILMHDDDPLLELVREEKTLITKYDLEEDPRYAHLRDACLRSFAEMRASLVIPLLSQGKVTGVLAVGTKKSGYFYSGEDVDLLRTMANQAAVAIENATTHEEVVRYADELAQSLKRIQILESIKSNLVKFVPRTVQALIEESPEAPLLDKREVDVSVLFADITGYTRLSAQLELDQVNRLVERYFGAFLDEILQYGGDVNETAGDGLMVIFQDPDPQQHARAAVRAALAIQRRTREINAELRGQFEPIAMHVGVNSGIAAVGATKIEGAAGTRWTFTASGPTTNVAARLAALGEGGAVVLSEETRRRLGDEFEAEDLGPQALKNVPEPVRAFRMTCDEPEAVAERAGGAGE